MCARLCVYVSMDLGSNRVNEMNNIYRRHVHLDSTIWLKYFNKFNK